MKNINLQMPIVQTCAITQCAYNAGSSCQAKAITIGDMVEPECDTFFQAQPHHTDVHRRAGVGACKVLGCRHNQDYECTAESIQVGQHNQRIHCLTYSSKP